MDSQLVAHFNSKAMGGPACYGSPAILLKVDQEKARLDLECVSIVSHRMSEERYRDVRDSRVDMCCDSFSSKLKARE